MKGGFKGGFDANFAMMQKGFQKGNFNAAYMDPSGFKGGFQKGFDQAWMMQKGFDQGWIMQPQFMVQGGGAGSWVVHWVVCGVLRFAG